MTSPARTLTRAESKLITRRRLIEAGLMLLSRDGYAGLTASGISKEAGIAQPSFYVHFKDKEDLVRSLARELMAELRTNIREFRRQMFAGEPSEERLRESFRIPIDALLAQPALFRLFLQERMQPGSPAGEVARELRQDMLDDLVGDLIEFGIPADTTLARERVELVAEGMVSLLESWGLGILDGRYTDVDQILDLLVAYSGATIGL